MYVLKPSFGIPIQAVLLHCSRSTQAKINCIYQSILSHFLLPSWEVTDWDIDSLSPLCEVADWDMCDEEFVEHYFIVDYIILKNFTSDLRKSIKGVKKGFALQPLKVMNLNYKRYHFTLNCFSGLLAICVSLIIKEYISFLNNDIF